MIPFIFLPDSSKASELEEAVRAQFRIIREEKEQIDAKFVLKDANHRHDPQWRGRLMSIQAAADAASGKTVNFWTVIAILFYFSQIAFVFGFLGSILYW